MFNGLSQTCGRFLSFGRYNNGGSIMMIIGIAVLVVIAYFVFRKGTFSNSGSSESPLEALQKRFVDGEIDEKEYLSKKEILRRK